MGKGMIKNLVTKLQRPLVIWNRGAEAAEEMKQLYPDFVSIASSPADVVKQCTTTFCMLSTPEASKAVFEDAQGVFAGVSAGKVIVDCATLTPERMKEENEIITSKGGLFLEAPVGGSKVPAETGQLIFMCGGEESLYSSPDITAALEAMGKASFLFGPVGNGTKVKLVNNMIMGTMLASVAEGCALATASDIPLEKLFQVLDLGAMAMPMLKAKAPSIMSGEYATNFPLKHAQKDMKFAISMAEQAGLSLPTTEAANSVYVKAIEAGRGDDDFSAVYTVSKDLKK